MRLGLRRLARDQAALREHLRAGPRAELRLLREALYQDVRRALERARGVGESLLLVLEREGPELEPLLVVLARLRLARPVAHVPEPVGELLQAGLARQRGFGF